MSKELYNYNFNIELYSRQLGIIDSDSMTKLTSMKYLIIGLRGLGVEILKNLILEGPKRVDIYDPNYININDLNSNYFVKEKDINKIRDEIIIEKIKDLNPFVQSDIIRPNYNLENNNYENELKFILSKIEKYNMIIITEFISKNSINKINSICKKLNKGLIYSCALGLSGFLFNFFSNEHIVSSPSEKNDTYYPIKNIIKGEETIIQLEKSLEGFPDIIEDDYIKLRDINGINEFNEDKIYKITKRISISEYKININSKNFNDYTYGGFLQVISLPVKMSFQTLEENIKNPMKDKELDIINTPFIGRSDIVHSIIISLYNNNYNTKDKNTQKRSYIIDEDILPNINEIIFQKEIIESAKIIYNNSKNKKENWIQLEDIYDETSEFKEFDEDMVKNLCLYLKFEIPPITSFLGGIVAQEAIKLTGRFTPFNQWFEFEFNYLSTKNEKLKENNNMKPSRYYEQIQIFGEEVQKKINSLKIFMVGVGAIGCEYLKNFAMMGISSGKNGILTITDFDKIELSNLNRQFLFRENNIGQFKSEVAKYYIKQMNNSINILTHKKFVGDETENIFSDKFWDEQDIIFNAVDNVKARFYLNDKVCIHKKYHFDAGTLGVNSSCGFFMKNISSTYKDQNKDKKIEDDNNNNLRDNGLCTIHSFPTCIKHCIAWALNEYKYLFSKLIIELNEIINGDIINFYKILSKEFYKKLKIKEISDIFDIFINKNFNKAIVFSYEYFMNKFNFEIKKILIENPENSRDKEGKSFYNGSKHMPKELNFNISDELDSLIINYIKSLANLIFDCLGLKKNETDKNLKDSDIKKICLNSNIPNYDIINYKSLKSGIVYNKEYCQKFIHNIQQKLINNLSLNSIEDIKFTEVNFEKDNYNKNQYNFIYSCSNLRAINFQIPQGDFITIKNLSSNIVPSIVTSNAVITGLVSMQIYLLAKLMLDKEKNYNNILDTNDALNLFRNYYIDLGKNSYSFSHIPKKVIIKTPNIFNMKSYNAWDSIIIKGPKSINDFIKYFLEKYKVKIISIFSGKSLLFNVTFEQKENFEKTIEAFYKKVKGLQNFSEQKYLILEINAKTIDEKEANLPRIKYLISSN